MSQTDPQAQTANPDSRETSGGPAAVTVENHDQTLHSEANEKCTLEENPNPRSPKRPRLSPAKDDTEIDFEAAAARALAISLGVDPVSNRPAPVDSHARKNGTEPKVLGDTQRTTPTPDQQALIDKLPDLDDVANQILSTLAKLTHIEIGEMLFGPPSLRGKDYRELKYNFERTKSKFLTNSPFISIPGLGLKEPDQVEILRKTNMATFMASIFSGEIGLRIMDINFLDVFVPENGRLLKAQASIYLELKTQAFITAKRSAPAMLDQVMLDLFPNDMEKSLLSKRPGAKSLAPSESDFLKRLASRRDILYADMRNKRLDNLERRYQWDSFSREVNGYLTRNYDQSGKEKEDYSSPNPVRAHLPQEQMESQFSIGSSQTNESAVATSTNTMGLNLDFNIDDFMAQAARAAEIALQGPIDSGYVPTRPDNQSFPQSPKQLLPVSAPPAASPAILEEPSQRSQTPTASVPSPLSPRNKTMQNNVQITETEFQQYKPAATDSPSLNTTSKADDAENGVPHRSQTAPTQVLYERARLVTTNKAALSRRPNSPSHRRPWTNDEENALMTGLDQVKGPHWSQILAMYGPGGTINESLKDRNQVQLKDKARNLKLFFLKAGIEVPYYLQAVTGDLKTRAPGQAEKREAKERERINFEEDDLLAQQDESQIDLDDLDTPIISTADQNDVQEPGLSDNQTVNEQKEDDGTAGGGNEDDAFDVETLLAKAAASVTESLGNP